MDIDRNYEERWGWRDPGSYVFEPKRGLSREVVEEISFLKSEPKWMRDFRLKAYDRFERRPMPHWGADLSGIDFQNIFYFLRATDKPVGDWDEVPEYIKNTYDRLGIPEAERKYLAGVSAQYECLRGDARVWTTTGKRRIDKIEPGDEVFALDQESRAIVPAKVLGTKCSGEKEVFEIRAGGRVVAASANHPFLVGAGPDVRWAPVSKLNAGDTVIVGDDFEDAASAPMVGTLGGVATLARMKLRPAAIESVTSAGVEPVWDIEVEGHHNFVAEGFIVHNSEVVYHKVKDELTEKGVLFTDMDSAVREHPEIVKKFFATVIPPNDNKLAALNSSVWSGGSFIYVPPGVQVDIPLQAYFRINAENVGQFERTLIIADEGSYVHYVEGCLPAGELVATADGDHRPIEEIRVGDRVLTHEGRPERVTAVQVRDYRGSMHTFVPCSPDNAFRVTSEHPLLVVPRSEVRAKRADRNGRKSQVDTKTLLAATPRWVEAKDVEEGDFLVFPKSKPAPAKVVFPIELARLTGYYLADGSASLTNGFKSLQFSFNIDDHDSIEEVRRLCKELYDKAGSVFWNEDKHEARVLVYTELGYEAMRTHIGTRSHTKQLSADFYGQDPEFLRNLVETYLRGDGNIVRNGKTWRRAHTTSRVWAHQLQAIMARLGTYATVSLRRPAAPGVILGRDVMRRAIYQVQWTEGDRRSLLVRDAGDYFLVPIQRVAVEDFDGLVYNLDVRAPDSYLASGFAVHNCTAPVYSSESLHSAVVELIAMPHARIRYTTIQNWAGNVYNLVTKRAVAHENAIVEWVDGNLGCIAQGSRVTTRGGQKPIELLVPGEEVLSFDEPSGKLVWRRVLGKKFSGWQPVREVRSGVRSLRVTDNHPFYSYTYDPTRAKKLGRYELAYVRADHLTSAIVPRTSIDYGHPYKLERPIEAVSFTTSNQYASDLHVERARKARLVVGEQTDEDLMWLFGLFVGDGSIDGPAAQNGGRRWAKVTLATPVGDRARSRLVAVMDRLLPGVAPMHRADGVALTWNSVELAELLELNGFHSGASKKRVPEWVLDLPESQRLSFVAGYLDADGCASRGERWLSIKSVNPDLLRDVADVLTSLGIAARFHTEHEGRPARIMGYDSVSRGSHRLELVPDERLLTHVPEGLRAAAAAQLPSTHQMRRAVGRSSIVLPDSVEVRKPKVGEPLVTVPTWDIEVEGTGNFVCEGFIVHNSRVTMKYPAVVLMGRKAHGEVLSLAMAGRNQHQDTGAKMTHVAPETTSTIISKSISKDGGRTSYRGGIWVQPGATHAKSNVRCDALLIDEESVSDTYPYMDIREQDVEIGHEATVARIGDEQLFYLMSRGIPEAEAAAMIVRGFIEPITKQLPMEYAVELNRLIELQMEGSVG
jgi:Fe-S cluster assembly protein SufB